MEFRLFVILGIKMSKQKVAEKGRQRSVILHEKWDFELLFTFKNYVVPNFLFYNYPHILSLL